MAAVKLLVMLVPVKVFLWTMQHSLTSGFGRIGQVDDLHLHETKLKPRLEQFAKDRVAWQQPIEGIQQYANGALP